MPLYPLDTKEYWDWLYDMGAERAWGKPGGRPEVRLNYHKYTTLENDRIRAANIVPVLGWGINSRVCVYRCGFGWILMALWEHSVQLIQGIENSPYIQSNLTINEDADIQAAIEAVGLDIGTGDGLTIFNALRDDGNPRALYPTRIHDTDVSSKPQMNQLRSLLGGPGSDVLTYEFELNKLTDQEAIDLSVNLRRLQPARLIHFINPLWDHTDLPGGGEVDLNAKTAEEWKTILPDDSFIELQGYRFVE